MLLTKEELAVVREAAGRIPLTVWIRDLVMEAAGGDTARVAAHKDEGARKDQDVRQRGRRVRQAAAAEPQAPAGVGEDQESTEAGSIGKTTYCPHGFIKVGGVTGCPKCSRRK
jgi:hypothetical protein